MSTITILIVCTCLAIGYYLGRQAAKTGGATCPQCDQERLYYCRGCGHHFDEQDDAIDPREFDRITRPVCRPDEVDS